MALVTCNFFSEVLEMSTSMTVILPQQTQAQIGLASTVRSSGGHPTLYLLHGLSDDATAWSRHTSIERYAAELGLAVIMPQVAKSFYADEVHGDRYWTFLTEELPALAESFFRLSPRRADRFVAGLSMGGYGAFKWALRAPDRFAAAASLSGVLDVAVWDDDPHRRRREVITHAFGTDPVRGTDNDLVHLATTIAPEDCPALFQWCGTEDVLYSGNIVFEEAAKGNGLPLTSSFSPGDHDWARWDEQIQNVLAWLPLEPTEG
jgi:putative tributyrin esterase